jgi:hypothetical protein
MATSLAHNQNVPTGVQHQLKGHVVPCLAGFACHFVVLTLNAAALTQYKQTSSSHVIEPPAL